MRYLLHLCIYYILKIKGIQGHANRESRESRLGSRSRSNASKQARQIAFERGICLEVKRASARIVQRIPPCWKISFDYENPEAHKNLLLLNPLFDIRIRSRKKERENRNSMATSSSLVRGRIKNFARRSTSSAFVFMRVSK